MYSISSQLDKYKYQSSPFLKTQIPISSQQSNSRSNMAILNEKIVKQTQYFSKKRQYDNQRLSSRKLSRSSSYSKKKQQQCLHPDVKSFLKIQQKQQRKRSIQKYKLTSPISSFKNITPIVHFDSQVLKKSSTNNSQSKHNFDKKQQNQNISIANSSNYQQSIAYIRAKKEMQTMIFFSQQDEQQDSQDNYLSFNHKNNKNDQNFFPFDSKISSFSFENQMYFPSEKQPSKQIKIQAKNNKSFLPPKQSSINIQQHPIIIQTFAHESFYSNPEQQTIYHSCNNIFAQQNQ